MSRIYAGIGARKTPSDVLSKMTRIAKSLASQGWTLRSGAADGADAAFESGAGSMSEIYLPWKKFNNNESVLCDVCDDALLLASQLHPKWNFLSAGAKKLHARNCYQILGKKLDNPVRFVICWTPDGAITESQCSEATGGTATAIKLADRMSIPVFNLKLPEHAARIDAMLDKWLRSDLEP